MNSPKALHAWPPGCWHRFSSHMFFSSISSLLTKFLEECSGCGAQFHENGLPGSPGYLPNLSSRRDKILQELEHARRSSPRNNALKGRQLSRLDMERIENRLNTTCVDDRPITSMLPEQPLGEGSVKRKKPAIPICQKCHNLLNKKESPGSNERSSISVITPLTKNVSIVNPNLWWEKFLATYNAKRAIFCLLVDSTDFPTSWATFHDQSHQPGKLISHLQSMEDIQVIIALTKIDLLPLSITGDEKELAKFRNHVKEWAATELIKRPVFDVVPVSAKSGFNCHNMIASLTKAASILMRGKPPSAKASIYLVGPTNSGKSKLWTKIINTKRFFENKCDTAEPKISISTLSPGTTVGFFSASLHYAHDFTKTVAQESGSFAKNSKKSVLIDTPGVFPFGWIPRFLTLSSLEKLFSSSSPFKANRYLVLKGQSMWIGPLVRIDLCSNTHAEKEQDGHKHFTNFVIFATRKLPIHINRTFAEAEKEYQRLKKEQTSPLTQKQLKNVEIPELKVALDGVEIPKGPIRIPGIEIALSGIGWIAISHAVSGNDDGIFLRVWTPEGVGAYLRPNPLFLNSIKESVKAKADQQKRILFKTLNCRPKMISNPKT